MHRRIALLKEQRAKQDNPGNDQANAAPDGNAGPLSYLGRNNHLSANRSDLGRKPSIKSPVQVSLKDDRLAYKSDTRRLGPLMLWSEGTAVGLKDGNGEDQRFRIVHSGAEMMLGTRTLLGLGVQFDNLRYADTPTGDEFDGTGWMIGPYFHSRVIDNLFVDVRLAFGKVNTDVTRAAGVTDEYESDRALAQLHIVGDFAYGGLLIAPIARVDFYREGSKAYISNVHGAIPETTVELVHGEIGGRISRTYNVVNGTVSPYFEALAVHYDLITGDDNLLALSYADSMQGWSAKVGAGLRASLHGNTMITLGTEYTDGQDGAWSLGGSANVAVKF